MEAQTAPSSFSTCMSPTAVIWLFLKAISPVTTKELSSQRTTDLCSAGDSGGKRIRISVRFIIRVALMIR